MSPRRRRAVRETSWRPYFRKTDTLSVRRREPSERPLSRDRKALSRSVTARFSVDALVGCAEVDSRFRIDPDRVRITLFRFALHVAQQLQLGPQFRRSAFLH